MITIKDIAKAANVSKSTVSRVLNKDSRVKPTTRTHVEQVIKELGYVPNMAARNMRSSKTFSVGILFPDLTNAFFSEWYVTIDRLLATSGYLGYICVTDSLGKTELKRIQDLVARQIDGIVYFSYVKNQEVLEKLRELSSHTAIVCGDYFAIQEGLPYVVADGQQGTLLAIAHLVGQGKRRIGYIRGEEIYQTTIYRYYSYKNALTSFNIPYDETLVFQGNFKEEDGIAAADYFLSLSNPPEAIASSTDVMALACLQRLVERGVKVPDDIAVIGFDNINLTEKSKPTLSSVNMPIEQMAQETIRLLLDQINGKTSLVSKIIPCELVLRGST